MKQLMKPNKCPTCGKPAFTWLSMADAGGETIYGKVDAYSELMVSEGRVHVKCSDRRCIHGRDYTPIDKWNSMTTQAL